MLVTVFSTEEGKYALHTEAVRLYGQARIGEHGKCIGSMGDTEKVACISDRVSNELEIAIITTGLGVFKEGELSSNVHLNNIHQRGMFKPVLLKSEAEVETYNVIDRMVAYAWSLINAPVDGDVFPLEINVMTMAVADGDKATPVTMLGFKYQSTIGTTFDTIVRPPAPNSARFFLDEGV